MDVESISLTICPCAHSPFSTVRDYCISIEWLPSYIAWGWFRVINVKTNFKHTKTSKCNILRQSWDGDVIIQLLLTRNITIKLIKKKAHCNCCSVDVYLFYHIFIHQLDTYLHQDRQLHIHLDTLDSLKLYWENSPQKFTKVLFSCNICI